MLLGDFFQIAPIGGGDLYLEPKNVHSEWGLDALEGYRLFKKFTVIDLTGQHRATNIAHMQSVAAFRDWSRHGLMVREKFFAGCKQLSLQDTWLIQDGPRHCL